MTDRTIDREGEEIQDELLALQSVFDGYLKARFRVHRVKQVLRLVIIFVGSAAILFGAPVLFRIPTGDFFWVLLIAVVAAIQMVMTGIILKSIATDPESVSGPLIDRPVRFQLPLAIRWAELWNQTRSRNLKVRELIRFQSPIGYRVPNIAKLFEPFLGSSLPTQVTFATSLWVILTLINWTVISAPYTIGFLDPIFVGSVEPVNLYTDTGVSSEFTSFYLVAIPILFGEISALGLRSIADIRGWTEILQQQFGNDGQDTFWTHTNIQTLIELTVITFISWVLVNILVLTVDSFVPSASVYASFLAGWGIITTKHLLDTYITTAGDMAPESL